MEPSNLSVGSSSTKQGVGRRGNMSIKDLWDATRSGTVHDVDASLMLLKRVNGNVDARNYFGSTSLHIAVWRNHVPIVRRLLAAGADPDARVAIFTLALLVICTIFTCRSVIGKTNSGCEKYVLLLKYDLVEDVF